MSDPSPMETKLSEIEERAQIARCAGMTWSESPFLTQDIPLLIAELKKSREALKFYGHWVEHFAFNEPGSQRYLKGDAGQRARQALETV